MTSLIRVEECASELEKRMRVLDNNDDDYEDDYYESTVVDLDEDNDQPHVHVRSHGKRKPVTWTHYIAAVEMEWDYQQERGDKRLVKKVKKIKYTIISLKRLFNQRH